MDRNLIHSIAENLYARDTGFPIDGADSNIVEDYQEAAKVCLESLLIPVTEDLPDNEERVWIFRKGQSEPEKGYQSGVDWLSVETGFPIIVHGVTHWMPMLMPAMKEKGEQ